MRISVSENPEIVTIKLEGRITSTGLTEIDRAWKTVASDLNSRKLRIDLRGVTFVDSIAEKLFQEIYHQTGAEFQTSSLVTRYFVDRTVHGVNNFSKNQRQ